MSAIYAPIIAELLKEVVLPVLGAVLLGYATLAAAKIKEKTGVDITEKLNTLLHKALERGADALVREFLSKDTTVPVPVTELAKKLAKQVQTTNPDTLKGLGNPNLATLEKLARQTIERALSGPA